MKFTRRNPARIRRLHQGEVLVKLGRAGEAAAAFEAALGANGYRGALRVSRVVVDALAGQAEVQLAAARLLASQGDTGEAAARFAASAQLYTRTFEAMHQSGPRWKFTERCEVGQRHRILSIFSRSTSCWVSRT